MNRLTFGLLAAVVLMAVSCEDIALVLNQDIATYTHEEVVYFRWDLNVGEVSAWNLINERVHVKLDQWRDKAWMQVFCVDLDQKTREGRHSEINVIISEGDEFRLEIRPHSQQGNEYAYIRLERDKDGNLQACHCDP